MSNTIILCSYLLWLVYSTIEGIREGYYWHYTLKMKQVGMHTWFTIQRSLFLSTLVLGFLVFQVSILNTVLMAVSCILAFSFFHNGALYTTRNLLDSKSRFPVYPHRWLDQSTTSTAFWTKYQTPLIRTTLFIISLILITKLLNDGNH